MPAYKHSKTGTWFVKFYCKDWTGENKQIKKRGFVTKREALDYERNYKIRQENNLDMTFGEFWKLYTDDVKNHVKLYTWLTKEHIVDTKILPYFKNLKMNEITPGDVRKWQNEMVAFRYENGKSYSQTYKKTMHNILSAIFNHACYLWFYRSEWSWEDNLSEDDQWTFQANLWRNRDVRIQGKGFAKSSITDRMSD